MVHYRCTKASMKIYTKMYLTYSISIYKHIYKSTGTKGKPIKDKTKLSQLLLLLLLLLLLFS